VSTPRFLVDSESLAHATAVLSGAELHHLRVRRLRPGNELILSDGGGHARRGILVALDHRQALVRFLSTAATVQGPALHLVLAQAMLKGDLSDLVIEKATELGVSGIVFFASERAIARGCSDRRARWLRVARSAAKQSQRNTIPEVSGPLQFAELLHRPESLRLLFVEAPTAPPLRATSEPPDGVLAAVGPPGGFTPAEVERAAGAGFRLVGLGPRILRAETAALAAVTLCQFLWGDLGAGRE